MCPELAVCEPCCTLANNTLKLQIVHDKIAPTKNRVSIAIEIFPSANLDIIYVLYTNFIFYNTQSSEFNKETEHLGRDCQFQRADYSPRNLVAFGSNPARRTKHSLRSALDSVRRAGFEPAKTEVDRFTVCCD